jgi:hypothetical protein
MLVDQQGQVVKEAVFFFGSTIINFALQQPHMDPPVSWHMPVKP